MSRLDGLVELLRLHVAADDREEADRCAMLRLARELSDPLSRSEPTAHFTASAFVVDTPIRQSRSIAAVSTTGPSTAFHR